MEITPDLLQKARRAYCIGGDVFVALYKNCIAGELNDCLAGRLAELNRRNQGEELPCSVAVGMAR